MIAPQAAIVAAACARAGDLSLLACGRGFALPEGEGALRLPDMLEGLPAAPGDRAAADDAETAPRHFRASRLVRDVAAAALADAGLSREDVAGPGTGFVSGSHYGCVDFLDGMRAAEREKGPRGVKPTEFAIATQGYPVAALGMTYGAQGPATAFVGGLTAGFEALAFARAMLAFRQCDRMVVIGYELPGDRAGSHLRALGAGDGEVAETVVAFVVERASPRALAIVEDLRAGFDPGVEPRPTPPALGADGLLRLFRALAASRAAGREAPLELTCADPLGAFAALRVRPLAACAPARREDAA